MDIAARLKQLHEMVAEAKTMPLSSSVLLNRDEILEVIAAIGEQLPEEIKQARWVVKDREELMAKARRDAEALIQKAKIEQARLAGKQEVVQRAREEAGQLLGDARAEARQIRLEAEDYVDQKLAQFEAALARLRETLEATGADVASIDDRIAKTLDQVHAGREKLRGEAPVEIPDAQPAPEEVP